MDHLTDRDHAAYAAVNDALRTYPLEPSPPGILPAVMGRIEGHKPAPEPFHLAWIDYAVSIFAAGMSVLVLLVWSYLPLPPDWTARLQVVLQAWWQRIHFIPPIVEITLLGTVMLSLCAFLVAALLFAPGRRSRI